MSYEILNTQEKHGDAGQILTSSRYDLIIKSTQQRVLIRCDYNAMHYIDTFIDNIIDIFPLISMVINSGGIIDNLVIMNF